MRRPYVPIYKGDWKNDPALQCCSLAAQAVWLLMLMSIDDSPRPGFLLKANCEIPSDGDLARLMGQPIEVVTPLVGELGTNKVFARVTREDIERGGVEIKLPRGKVYSIPVESRLLGCIYSRRRLREEALSEAKRRPNVPANVEQTYPQTLDHARATNSNSISNSNSLSDEAAAAAGGVWIQVRGSIEPWEPKTSDIVGWRDAFPLVPVEEEIRKMREWVLSNLDKQPSFNTVRKFVTSWLNREQRRLEEEARKQKARAAQSDTPDSAARATPTGQGSAAHRKYDLPDTSGACPPPAEVKAMISRLAAGKKLSPDDETVSGRPLPKLGDK